MKVTDNNTSNRHLKSKSMDLSQISNSYRGLNSSMISQISLLNINKSNKLGLKHYNNKESIIDEKYLIREDSIPIDDFKKRLKLIMEDYKYQSKILEKTKNYKNTDGRHELEESLKSTRNKSRTRFVNEETAIQISIKEEDYHNPYRAKEVLNQNNKIYNSVLFNFQIRKENKKDQYEKLRKEISASYKDYSKLKVSSLIPKSHEIININNINNNINNNQKVDNPNLPQISLVQYNRENLNTDMSASYYYAKHNFPEGREQFSWSQENKQIILYGGIVSNKSNNIWEMDPLTLEWKIIDSDGHVNPRYGHSGILYQKKLFLFGGKTKVNNYPYIPDLEIFNIEDRNWININVYTKNTLKLRRNHVAVLYGSYMFVHGGISEDEEYLNDCGILNLSPVKWQNVSYNQEVELPTLAWHSCCVVLPKDILMGSKLNLYKLPENRRYSRIKEKGIYLFGGKSSENGNFRNDVWVLRTGKKPLEWIKINTYGTPPSPRSAQSMNFFEDGNYLIIHGGRNDTTNDSFALNDTYLLELQKLDWIKVNLYFDLPGITVYNRCGHSALINIILGGMNSNNYIGSSMLIIDLDSHGKPRLNKENELDTILNKYEENKNVNKSSSRKSIINVSKKSQFNSNVLLPYIK